MRDWLPPIHPSIPSSTRIIAPIVLHCYRPRRLHSQPPTASASATSAGMYVFDFGQNLAGFVRLSLPAPVPAGAVITIRHAETVMVGSGDDCLDGNCGGRLLRLCFCLWSLVMFTRCALRVR